MKRIITDKNGNVLYRDGIRIPFDSNSPYDVLINVDIISGMLDDVKNDRWLFVKYYGLGELKSLVGDRKSSSNKLRKREVFALKVSPQYKEEMVNALLIILKYIQDRQPYEKIKESLKEIEIDFDTYVVRKISPISGEVIYLTKRNIPTQYKPKMTFRLTNIKVVRYKRLAILKKKALEKQKNEK